MLALKTLVCVALRCAGVLVWGVNGKCSDKEGASVTNMHQAIGRHKCKGALALAGPREMVHIDADPDFDGAGPSDSPSKNTRVQKEQQKEQQQKKYRLSKAMLLAVQLQLDLVKLFVTTTTPWLRLNNVHLRSAFKRLEMVLKDESWFRKMVLEEVHKVVKEAVDKKLTVPRRTARIKVSSIRARWDWYEIKVGRHYKRIASAALRLLSAHGTTGAAETNWSVWGNTYKAGRAAMTIEHGEKLVFIKSNLGLSGEVDKEEGTDDDEEPMVQLLADNTFDLAFNLTDKFMLLHDKEPR
ncbi:hypothetical protein FOA52_013013 [Chlamydomonas sp. UWO 241]|nr:hypothetical protein FOA52_013013 [Chlamydomonas sp. UWO 241]